MRIALSLNVVEPPHLSNKAGSQGEAHEFEQASSSCVSTPATTVNATAEAVCATLDASTVTSAALSELAAQKAALAQDLELLQEDNVALTERLALAEARAEEVEQWSEAMRETLQLQVEELQLQLKRARAAAASAPLSTQWMQQGQPQLPRSSLATINPSRTVAVASLATEVRSSGELLKAEAWVQELDGQVRRGHTSHTFML